MFSSYNNILTFQIFMNQGMYFLVSTILKLFHRFRERSNVRLIHSLKYIVLFYVLMPLYFESSKVVKKTNNCNHIRHRFATKTTHVRAYLPTNIKAVLSCITCRTKPGF